MDQMLDKLAGKDFGYFLDGYSSYNNIAITPDDKAMKTFTHTPMGFFI